MLPDDIVKDWDTVLDVGRVRLILPEVIVADPAKKIEPEGVNLLPPFSVNKPEAEKLFCTDIELLVIVTAALLVKLPDILNGDGRLSVSVPVLRS